MECDASLFFPARAVLGGICDPLNPNANVIKFDHSLFASFADVQAHAYASSDAHDTVISYDANDTITLVWRFPSLYPSDFF